MIWFIVYVVSGIISAVLLAIAEARGNGVFSLADLGYALGGGLVWPMVLLFTPSALFPFLNNIPRSSDIVLWRRNGGDK